MDTGRPYTDLQQGYYVYRTFDAAVEDRELQWHRDREDREIEVVDSTDWLYQEENKLPVPMTRSFIIKKGTWHRVIKGTGSLNIRIYKL